MYNSHPLYIHIHCLHRSRKYHFVDYQLSMRKAYYLKKHMKFKGTRIRLIQNLLKKQMRYRDVDIINMYRTIHQEETQIYERALDQYLSIQTQMQQETDHIKKELLMIELSKMKRPTPPASIDQKINRLKSDIRALQQSDAQTYQKALKAAEQAPLSFSGSYERLLINGKGV